jgi:small subunit ribosomal protein S6e
VRRCSALLHAGRAGGLTLLPLLCLQRKRHHVAVKKRKQEKAKAEAAEYHKLVLARLKEQRERRSESMAKKRALRQASQASKEA